MSSVHAPLFAGLARNLLSGIRLALFLPVKPSDFSVSPGQFALLVGFNALVALGGDLVQQGWPGMLNAAALPVLLSHVPLLLLACLLAASLLGRGELLLPLAVALCAAEPLFEAVTLLLSVDPLGAWIGAQPVRTLSLVYVFIGWWLAVALRALWLFGGWRGVRTVYAGGVLVLMVGVFAFFVPRPQLWFAAEESGQADTPSVADESLFHLQPRLLEEALAQLEPERAGHQDLYFLGVAPYASEDVFVREVMAVWQLFDERFRTAGRSLVLANSPQTLAELPVATATNLRTALQHLGRVMNPEEDMLFLFITTHGDERHELAFELPPLRLQQLTPAVLSRILADSGIKWKVLVVSACYSGGFVNALRDDYTLVITAADADSPSFGCESGRDYTYFGQAFFAEALRQTFSFVEAFDRARERIVEWERQERLEPSSPQIHIGTAIRPRLAQLERQYNPGR